MVGEPGRGVPDDHRDGRPHAPGLRDRRAAGMRAGVVQATHHAAHRSAFGKPLIDQPLMRNVLADLCIESEAATALAMRLARAYDEAGARDAERRRARTTERRPAVQAPGHGGRQVLGVQARPQPRLRGAGVPRRQRLRRGVGHAAPVSRGAAGLDLGGLGQRDEPRRAARAGARAALARGVPARGRAGRGRRRAPGRPRGEAARGVHATRRRWRRARAGWSRAWRSPCRARCSCATAPPAVADAFCASRLGGDGGLEYGTLPAGTDFGAIIERNRPQV